MRRRVRQSAKRRPVEPSIKITQERGGCKFLGSAVQQEITVLGGTGFRVKCRCRAEFRQELPPTDQQGGVLLIRLGGGRLRRTTTGKIHRLSGRGRELELQRSRGQRQGDGSGARRHRNDRDRLKFLISRGGRCGHVDSRSRTKGRRGRGGGTALWATTGQKPRGR